MRNISRGILSPLWFYLALKPLSHQLNRRNYGFVIHFDSQEIQRLNHLLYMDDIKLYAATIKQPQELERVTQTFSRDVTMVLGIEKSKTMSIAKGKLELRNFTTEDDDTMEAMNEDDIYRYLGHMQSKQIKHGQMKQKLGEEYLNHTKSILNFRHRASCILGQVFHYSPENAFYIFNQQIYFII